MGISGSAYTLRRCKSTRDTYNIGSTRDVQWEKFAEATPARIMRLNKPQIEKINTIIRQYAGPDSRAYVFGSRTNDAARGGDIDLLILTPRPIPRLQRARLKVKLESALGLPVDVLVKRENESTTSFEKIALNNAQSLRNIRNE